MPRKLAAARALVGPLARLLLRDPGSIDIEVRRLTLAEYQGHFVPGGQPPPRRQAVPNSPNHAVLERQAHTAQVLQQQAAHRQQAPLIVLCGADLQEQYAALGQRPLHSRRQDAFEPPGRHAKPRGAVRNRGQVVPVTPVIRAGFWCSVGLYGHTA